MIERDFLGRGVAFPFRFENGKIAVSSDEDLVEESIKIILRTNPGERIMRPDFGSGIEQMVFSTGDTSAATMLAFYIRETLEKHEPRIELIDVKVKRDTGEANVLNIFIEYEIRASNSKRNMVYPFYLEGSN